MTAKSITTERVLTSPQGFGLTTGTASQRALCRILDGVPLGDLALHPDVRDAVGDVDALPSGVAAFEVHVLAAIRTAKSLIAAAKIIAMSQAVDASGLGRGDIVRIPVAALKLEGTRAVMGHLVANLLAKPLLRPLVVGEPKESGVELRHPSGRVIEVTPIPIDRAGGSAISVWNAGIVVDEEPRMLGEADGVKNWDHLRQAVLGRILPGGQFLGIGSPWAPFGPLYDLVTERGGKPSRDLVIFRARGPAMNPYWWTSARCADLQRRDATAYRTDVLAEFADAESGLIVALDVEACQREGPAELPRDTRRTYVAAMDPGTRGNAWPLVILEVLPSVNGSRRLRVALARQWMGTRGSPLSPETVLGEIAACCRIYGVTSVATDQYSVDAIRDLAARVHLRIAEYTITAERKVELFEGLRTLIASRQIELSPDPQVRADLLGLRKRVTQNGIAIALPTTSDGRHADYAAALALAAYMAPSEASALETPAPDPIPMHSQLDGW